MKTFLAITTLLILGGPIFAQNADSNSYCTYVEESAKAVGIALESPAAAAGITPNQGIQPQLVLGLSSSVNDIRKGRLTIEIGRKNCALYKDATTVTQRIQYDTLALDQDALQHRLNLIAQASADLDELVTQNEKILKAGNIPRQSIYLLEKQRLALELDKQATATALAQIYVPHLSIEPLAKLANEEFASNTENQRAQLQLTRLDNWDVNFQAGGEKPFTPFLTTPKAYVGVSASYNLGSRAATRHDSAAMESFNQWQRAQVGGVQESVRVFHGVVSDLIAVQTAELSRLLAEQSKIEEARAAIGDCHTSTADTFRNQLTADGLILRVQVGDTQYRLSKLRIYLQENF